VCIVVAVSCLLAKLVGSKLFRQRINIKFLVNLERKKVMEHGFIFVGLRAFKKAGKTLKMMEDMAFDNINHPNVKKVSEMVRHDC